MSGFPADSKVQSFLAQQYDKETTTRLKFNFENRNRTYEPGLSGNFGCSRELTNKVPIFGLPQINPMEYALRVKRQEEAELKEIRQEAARQRSDVVMRPPETKVKDTLYEGISKEQRGRYQYLTARRGELPEEKYTFPVTSSYVYGWKLNEGVDRDQYARPTHARTPKIHDSFYSRNRVPTMSNPNLGAAGGIEHSPAMVLQHH